MWALTADADFLAQRGQGQVEQVFARAVNIALPARQQLLTLLCEEYDNAPNSCRLALTHFDDLFRHGDKVQFDDQGITVGQHLHIEMSRCRRWLSPTLQMTAVNFHLIAWQQWHDIIHQHLGENETLFNYRGDNPFYQALNKELHIKRRAVIQAVNEKQNIAAAVASMMGLGIGLTPSADDYLTGLVLILFISGHPAEKYKEEFIRFTQFYNTHNLWTKFKALPQAEKENKALIKAMRHYDYTVNIKWVMAHYNTANHYLNIGGKTTEATGGSEWVKYMHPKYQRRIFFPDLWTKKELQNWGTEV